MLASTLALFTKKILEVNLPHIVMQGPDRHGSLQDVFPREENAASTSSIRGASGQRYAATARLGSIPKDSGISWPRSVMHGPEKHRSLFEAFAGLQRDSSHGAPVRELHRIQAHRWHRRFH